MHCGCLAVENAATADHSVKSGSVYGLDGACNCTRTTTVLIYFDVIHPCRHYVLLYHIKSSNYYIMQY